MIKNVILKLYYALAVLLIIIECGFVICENMNIDINSLPEGEFQYEVSSPNGKNVLNVYKIKNSVCSSVRVTANLNGKEKNIYWQTDEDKVEIEWAGDSVVFLNGVPLDISKGDIYDCRNGLAIFSEGSFYTSEF